MQCTCYVSAAVLMTAHYKANCPSGIIKIYTRLFCVISAALHLPHIWGGDHSDSIKHYDPVTTSHPAVTNPQKSLNNNKGWSWYKRVSSFKFFTHTQAFMKLVFIAFIVGAFFFCLAFEFCRRLCWLLNVLLISTWMMCSVSSHIFLVLYLYLYLVLRCCDTISIQG